MDEELELGGPATATDKEVQELEHELENQRNDNTGGDGGHQNNAGGNEEEDEDLDGGGEERRGTVDTEMRDAANDEERDAIRARRREERQQKKNRARERVQTLERQVQQTQRQLQEATQQIALLTQQSAGVQMARLDSAIEEVNNAVAYFESEIADATTKGDGEAVAKATNNLFSARERQKELATFKEAMGKQRPGQPSRQLDPQLVNHARDFMGKHRWYGGPRAQDMDSRILSQIDNAVAAEGFDPTGPEYWQELENRAKQYLPHRFRDGGGDDDDASRSTQGGGQRGGSGNNNSGYNGRGNGDRRPRQPVAGNSGDARGPKGGGEGFHLSAERVKAIKEAGKWDDPAERKKMIDAYKSYDARQRG